MSEWFNFGGMFDGIHKAHEQKKAEFDKLVADQSMILPNVGDRVVVAAGPLSRGFEWIRLEAVVLEVGQSSYKVRFTKDRFDGTPDEEWVHPALITDVIKAVAPEAGKDGE